MYIKVEQINGKYRVTPDAIPEPVPVQETPRGMQIMTYPVCTNFINIPEKPYGIDCKAYQYDAATTDIWKLYDSNMSAVYDEVNKSFVVEDISIGLLQINYSVNLCDMYFIKFNNQVYALECEGHDRYDRYYDLIPYTQNDDAPDVEMDGNILTPGTIIPNSRPDVKVILTNDLPSWYILDTSELYPLDETMTGTRTINGGVLTTMSIDRENHTVGIHKYLFKES